MSYDVALAELRHHFVKLVNALLTPPSAAEVRLVVLHDIGQLCSFLGMNLTLISNRNHAYSFLMLDVLQVMRHAKITSYLL